MATELVQLLEKLPFHPLSLLPLFLLTFFLYKWLSITQHDSNKRPRPNPPPSPTKLPILGNFHQLMASKLPHRSLESLSKRYGELMLLHLGSKATLVVTSSDAAHHIMKTHDMIFANRPKLKFADLILYDGNDIAFGKYGEDWRRLKGIAGLHLLNNKKVQSYRTIREEEVDIFIQNIKKNSSGSSPINLSSMLLRLTNDMLSRIALGRKYGGDYNESTHFELLFKEATEVVGTFSVGDYIPWLGWIDRVTGLEARAENVRKGFDEFLKKVIQEHLAKGFKDDDDVLGENVKDFVDVLLQVQKEDPAILSADRISAVILDVFAAGTETTFTLLDWAVAEVLKCPRVMKKLQEEVRGMVKGKKRVTEDDLVNMKYLKATIKETLRLHPPLPMLLFRESSQDVKIKGYDIAAGTQVIINAWAIQRDAVCWEDPDEFHPERFLNSLVEYKGQHFQFIPFGAGRRSCAGISYAMANTELVFATLFYEFDWKIPGETLDMTECAGITTHRQHPLMVIATPHPCPQSIVTMT